MQFLFYFVHRDQHNTEWIRLYIYMDSNGRLYFFFASKINSVNFGKLLMARLSMRETLRLSLFVNAYGNGRNYIKNGWSNITLSK